MRDALSLTDQAIAYAAGRVTEESVRGMLGTLDDAHLIRILDCLIAKDGKSLLSVANEMGERSMSFSLALQDLSSLLQRLRQHKLCLSLYWMIGLRLARFAA